MRLAGPSHEIPLPARPRRVRRQRLLCLGFLPLLAAPLLLVSGPFAPVDHTAPVALRSVPGAVSHTVTTVAPAPPAVPAVRRPASTVPASVAVPSTTTTALAPQGRSAAAPTTAPATTTPPTTAKPAPTPAAPAGAAVASSAAPARPAPTTTTTTTPRPTTTTTPPRPTTTTTTAPPAPAPNRQTGQATWYRWKRGNCAHNSLPFGTRVTVTSVATGRSATCVVGDRGAFRSPTIIDLDASVFEQISPLGAGRIAVVISW